MKISLATILIKFLGVALLLCGSTGVLYAQETSLIEEIIVTAQKRSESLQDVPITVFALTGDKIKSLQLNSSKDMALHVPGLEWGGTANMSRPQIFLRGIGSTTFRDTEQNPIAIYFDEVFQGSSVSLSTQMMDLERVEILKGPQGTLWGRNATAGLINYVSRKPDVDDEAEGILAATAAQYGEFAVEGAVTIPITDKLSSRIAIKHSQRDGPFDAVGPNFQGDYGGWEWTSVRAQMVYQPNERLTIRPKIEWSKVEADPFNGGKHLGLFVPGAADFGATPCVGANTLGANCGDLLDNFGFNASNGIPNASVSTADIYEIEVDFRGFENTDSFSAGVNIAYEWDASVLTVIASANSFERKYHADVDFTASTFIENSRETDFDSTSLEARLSSIGDGSFTWALGAYFYSDQLDTAVCGAFDPFGLIFGGSLPMGCGASMIDIEAETSAIFADGTFQITDNLALTAGVRYTRDRRKANGLGFAYTPSGMRQYQSRSLMLANRVNPILIDASSSTTWNEPTGRLVLTYKPKDHLMFYAGWARGFKGGDFSGENLNANTLFEPADPEFSDNIEFGVKSELADRRLRINVAAYFNKFTDKQVFSQTVSPDGFTLLSSLNNAGQLDVSGIDAELFWIPTDNMDIGLNVAVIDSEFKDLQFTSFGTDVNYSGNTTEYTPELSVNGSFTNRWALTSGGNISLNVNANWTDDIFFELENNPDTVREELLLVDASIGYSTADGEWGVRLWGKNLTDEEYFTGGYDLAFAGSNFLNVGDPRVIGVGFDYSF